MDPPQNLIRVGVHLGRSELLILKRQISEKKNMYVTSLDRRIFFLFGDFEQRVTTFNILFTGEIQCEKFELLSPEPCPISLLGEKSHHG